MNTPLVIVDMQEEFTTAFEVVEPVRKRIRQAKTEDRWIINLMYVDHDELLPHLQKELKKYKQTIDLYKDNDGGGYIVDAWLADNDIGFDSTLEVCGVNACACVIDTAIQLFDCQYEVTLLADAIGCNRFEPHEIPDALKRMVASRSIFVEEPSAILSPQTS